MDVATLGALGKEYKDGEIICRQEEFGDRMFVIQSGEAEVIRQENGLEFIVGELAAGDVFGEMAIFEKTPRSATVRAKGRSMILSLDKRAFLKRLHEDPSLAYRIIKEMSKRVHRLDKELAGIKGELAKAKKSAEESRYLFIVSRDQPELYTKFTQNFSEVREVQVLIDRRMEERRQHLRSYNLERRQTERRCHKKEIAIQLFQN